MAIPLSLSLLICQVRFVPSVLCCDPTAEGLTVSPSLTHCQILPHLKGVSGARRWGVLLASGRVIPHLNKTCSFPNISGTSSAICDEESAEYRTVQCGMVAECCAVQIRGLAFNGCTPQCVVLMLSGIVDFLPAETALWPDAAQYRIAMVVSPEREEATSEFASSLDELLLNYAVKEQLKQLDFSCVDVSYRIAQMLLCT